MQVTKTDTGTSDWIAIIEPGKYRIDLDVPIGLTASVTIETTNDQAGRPNTAKQPTDITTDWELTASADFVIDGPVNVRFNVASRSGNSNPIKLSATQVNPH
jgi:hypothetical protein